MSLNGQGMRRAWPAQRSEEAEAKSGERSSVVFVEDKNGLIRKGDIRKRNRGVIQPERVCNREEDAVGGTKCLRYGFTSGTVYDRGTQTVKYGAVF